ncbi:hypothetical protein J3A78_002812 [Streptomyces sp. PvR006]|uniref:hypothetical protein n=1 Tax=Streptomyces sp. PvR006 TaxID=2817860 RepID=UPI001AE2149E|nr:hypothetical protein [Streptomyces sp. PvR006]MBP2582334.1 hypothetical protein [Streptomyces sp. PvR006]
MREWRYPAEEVARLADPSVKTVCLVNPSNPPPLAWSVRVSLADLDDLDHLKIGPHLRAIFDDDAEEWKASRA